MNYTSPVKNTFYFLRPTAVDEWQPANVPAVMGVMRKTGAGDFEVIDAFSVDSVPSGRDLLSDVRFGYWFAQAGSIDGLRFDAFAMPTSGTVQRENVVTLLSRTCGFDSYVEQNYAHAM